MFLKITTKTCQVVMSVSPVHGANVFSKLQIGSRNYPSVESPTMLREFLNRCTKILK